MFKLSANLILFLVFTQSLFCGEKFGNIAGKVFDESALSPVNGVKVEIEELKNKTFTDSNGFFGFYNLKYGTYTLIFSAESYHSSRVLFNLDSLTSGKEQQIYLTPLGVVLDTIDVHGAYFKKSEQINTSYSYAVYEELRKTPGAVEDIIKYFQSSPGVSFGNDQDNDIISRGGSSVENLVLIDGIEIQNPNHYGPPGSTGGSMSFVNLKLVQEADFYPGGFPAIYGDKLSSVMDIKFKEGDRDKQINEIYISLAGAGFLFEGPLTSKSSYIVGMRKSYFDLLKNQLETPLLPDFWDINFKVNYNLSKNEKLELVGITAFDKAFPYKKEDSLSKDMADVKHLTYGFKYSRSYNSSKLDVILSHSFDQYEAKVDYFKLDIKQHFVSLVASYIFSPAENLKINVFSGNKLFLGKYNVDADYGKSYAGYLLQNVKFIKDLKAYKISGGFNFTYLLFNKKLTANAGVRFDYLDYMNKGLCISPRAGLTYKLSDITFLNLNVGYYYQSPEFLWLLSRPDNKDLLYMKSNQAVLGFEHFLSADTKLSLETYFKYYNNYPVSLNDPYYLFLSENTGVYPDFLAEAVSKGRGYFAGIDFTIQKKNSGTGFYGYFTYSYTKSKFYSLIGGPQTSGFDFGNQMSAVAGYKTGSLWSLSLKAKYADGRPYTPIDYESSLELNRGVYDMSKYQKEKLPFYLRFDARLEKEFEFTNSSLALYLEVENILNRTNLWSYSWDTDEKKIVSVKHRSILPVIGARYRF